MSLSNKSFRNNRTGEIVKVIDSFENIAILENKQKIDVRSLMDSSQYTEQIDPGSFFNNQGAYNILAEKIKSIPTTNIKDDDGNIPVVSTPTVDFAPASSESAIIMSSEEDERAELAKKYGAQMNTSAISKQQEAFSRLLGEESEEVQRVEVTRDKPIQVEEKQIMNEPIQRILVEDPIIKMFKGVKRNVDFNITLGINNKIPRLDFIEMMEDSYETSIVEFLAEEFTNDLLSNPTKIKTMISDKIRSMITESKKTTNSQITDSVTQVKSKSQEIDTDVEKEKVLSKDLPKKTTRKTKTKKEN